MTLTHNNSLKNYIFQCRENPKRQFLLFLIVGGFNTLFGYCIFSLLVFFKLHYVAAMLISTIFGIIFNFFTTGRVVFKNAKNTLFLKFFMTYGVLYLLNISIIALLNKISANLYVNGAFSMAVLSIISFFANKYYVFRECR